MTSCQIIVTSFSFFLFMANFELSESQIPDVYSVKLTFSLTVRFYLTKTENRTKKSLTQLSNIALSKGTTFAKKMLSFCKKMQTSAKLRGPWY